MEHLRTVLTFSEWAIEFMAVPPVCFITVLAAIGLIYASQKQRPLERHLWKRYHLLALTHLLFLPCTIIVAVVWEQPVVADWNAPHHVDPAATTLLACLFYGSLLSCVFWVWRMKGFRWCAGSFMTLAELPILGALFIARMVVSGAYL